MNSLVSAQTKRLVDVPVSPGADVARCGGGFHTQVVDAMLSSRNAPRFVTFSVLFYIFRSMVAMRPLNSLKWPLVYWVTVQV
jgi:hypothetical protein